MSEDIARVSAVERAISILDAFDASSPRLTLADLHRKTDIAKPTLLRLMQSLLDHGLLMRIDNTTYCIGAAALRLAGLHTAVGRGDAEILGVLADLVAKTGETASYSIRQNEFRIYIYRVNSNYRLRDHLQPGDMAPLGQGATGKVLKAFSDDGGHALAPIREQFFATSSGEREPGMIGLSCPVFNHDGKLAGAVSVSGPSSRLTPERTEDYIGVLMAAASKLTVGFGGSARTFETVLKARATRNAKRTRSRSRMPA